MDSPSDGAAVPADSIPRSEVAGARTRGWERWAIALSLGLYLVYQFNAINHHGSWGQDFGTHLLHIARAYRSPFEFLTTYVENQNNPPLYHLMCAGVYRLTNHSGSVEVISRITAVLNAGAILLLHRLSLRMIRSPVLRVAAVVFLLFLPAGMIHAVVLAADSVATPATVLLMYLLVRLGEAGHRPMRQFVGWAVLSLLALTFAVSVKFTAVALVPAAAVVVALHWVARQTSARRAMLSLLVVVVAPTILGVSTYHHFRRYQHGNLGVSTAIDPFAPETELNVRSLLFLRPADINLLNAPPYDAPSDAHRYDRPAFDMAVPNRYSYIALLHLGVFTDIVNVYQYDPTDNYFGRRSENAQARMALAVKTAVPFTAAALVAVPWMLLWSSWRVIVRSDAGAMPVLTVLTISFAFFLVIVVFLPFTGALGGGYWLPRLIIPALSGFFLTTFALIDRTPGLGTTPAGRTACLAVVIFQSLVNLSFLWPWGVHERKPPDLNVLLPSDLAVKAELEVRFTPQPVGTCDPLLTVGRTARAYFVFAHHDGQGNVRLMYKHSGGFNVPQSEPFPADPTRKYRVEVHADPATRYLLVRLDGREVLRIAPWQSPPVFREEIHLLSNPVGGGLTADKFSGTAVSARHESTGGERWGRRRSRDRASN